MARVLRARRFVRAHSNPPSSGSRPFCRSFSTPSLSLSLLLSRIPLGYDVEHVCNLTDIDDKIIARMQRESVTLKDLTDK